MAESLTNEERIQSLADILSLVAIVGQIEKAAIQRVLLALGSSLLDLETTPSVDETLARKLLVEIARESGDEAARQIAGDIHFVARAWRPVLDEHITIEDPYRLLPFAEILFGLINHSGTLLQNYEAFDRFGGAELVLPMIQLSAALAPFDVPRKDLSWELVGFQDPSDQALVGGDADNLYLFKAASSGIDLRFSELERGSQDDARREHDVRIDTRLYAAFVAGLLGDMLYWAARLRSHALPGHAVWKRVQTLLLASDSPPSKRKSVTAPAPAADAPAPTDSAPASDAPTPAGGNPTPALGTPRPSAGEPVSTSNVPTSSSDTSD